mmetsp:Transcript_77593/g.222262  ORF Transcript_77593/g.222262 Transcript_77593/m.222262 type:complete len:103 (-) Transcript_77593:1040-1348(-)
MYRFTDPTEVMPVLQTQRARAVSSHCHCYPSRRLQLQQAPHSQRVRLVGSHCHPSRMLQLRKVQQVLSLMLRMNPVPLCMHLCGIGHPAGAIAMVVSNGLCC